MRSFVTDVACSGHLERADVHEALVLGCTRGTGAARLFRDGMRLLSLPYPLPAPTLILTAGGRAFAAQASWSLAIAMAAALRSFGLGLVHRRTLFGGFAAGPDR